MTTVVNLKESKYDVYIGRHSVFGNPFIIGKHGNRKEVIDKYREWFYDIEQKNLRKQAKKELKGKRLGCFCKPQACHGDIIADYVNKN